MEKIAFLFPGQGSQSVGMGRDFHQEFGFVRELFDMAEEISKINLSRLCFQGPMESLTDTVNLQPAVTAVNLSVLTAIVRENVRPGAAAGHSLGEFSALTAAGVLTDEKTFQVVHRRGELMHRESLKHRGAMHALIGLKIDEVEALVARAEGGIVSVANHNMEKQVVITGEPDPVQAVSSMAEAAGARAIPLKVSGAWHSELIRDAETDFVRLLETVPFQPPACPVIHNVTADTAGDPDEIRRLVGEQLCRPVRWFDSVRRLAEDGTRIFVEVGPGKVLTNLVKKIVPGDEEIKVFSVNSMKTYEIFLNAVR